MWLASQLPQLYCHCTNDSAQSNLCLSLRVINGFCALYLQSTSTVLYYCVARILFLIPDLQTTAFRFLLRMTNHPSLWHDPLLQSFNAFCCYFIFSLLVFCRHLARNFRLQMNSDIHDNSVSSN
jgi:hypothetical protein